MINPIEYFGILENEPNFLLHFKLTMQQKRKETAWKKNRKFGDIKGGRSRLKMADNIFKRYHSLLPPSEFEKRPVFFQDNSSRDFFHPASVDEIKQTLEKLPFSHTSSLTHIWLRKVKKKEYEAGAVFQASFISGSKVNLIVLNAFPKDLRMHFGKKKPSKKTQKFYSSWENTWIKVGEKWVLEWTRTGIQKYYLEYLLLFEIGTLLQSRYGHSDCKSSQKSAESIADNYAVIWGNIVKISKEL